VQNRGSEAETAIALIGDLLSALGASPLLAGEVILRAQSLGVDPLRVLAFRLDLTLAEVYGCAAERLGFAFSEHVSDLVTPAEFTPLPLSAFAGMRSLRARVGDEDVLFAAPDFATLVALGRSLAPDDSLRGRMCIVPPDAFARAITRHCAPRLMRQAVARPSGSWPGPTARIGLRSPAAVAVLGFLALCLVTALVSPFGFYLVPAALISLVLLIPSAFRLWATFAGPRARPLAPERLLSDAELPDYTVLVPLRDEAHMLPQIAAAIRVLDYPPEKLDIKLVVEAESPETVAAAARYTDDPRFSLVVVPPGKPATKPKALNYALPLARGRYVVIFDAEDVAEPDQLRKAASAFAQWPDIACLQASLTIDNADRHWIARMFAAEYAGHFEVLLPAIGYAALPMPLGGTSNHLRLAALEDAGGWDSFNVTEDADLGLRLARMGFTCAALDSRTFEEAPLSWRSWHRQRSRWMKGWMQTLIVHNHRPLRLVRELGLGSALAVNIFIGGMVVSTALHCVFLAALLLSVAGQLATTGSVAPQSGLYILILLLGYLGAAAASLTGLRRIGRRDLGLYLFTLPAYWLMGGLAALSALWGLIRNPYYWAKTDHAGPARPHYAREDLAAYTRRGPGSADASAPGE